MSQEKEQVNGTLQEKKLLLSQAYFEQKSAAQLVELAAELLGNPVMLLDSTYRCLACFPDERLGVPSWDIILELGHMSEEVVMDMGRYLSRMRPEQRKKSYIYEAAESTGENFKKIVSGINYDNQVYGGIAVAEYSQPLKDEDIQFCDYLCSVLGSLLFKEVFLQKNFNTNYEQLFWDILSKTGTTTKLLEGRLEALGLLSVHEPFYLVYVDILPEMKENVDYIRINLKEKFPHFFTVFYQDSLLVVGNIVNEAYAQMIALFQQFFDEHSLFACISNPFSSLTLLREQYSLARQGCTVGQKLFPQTSFYEFKNLNLYCLLEESAGYFSLQNYLHPAVRTLKTYDDENGTDYYRTLILYLENNLNILITAKQLFIHRNTLNYRLKKISQLLNVSLEDKYSCMNILFAHLYDQLID